VGVRIGLKHDASRHDGTDNSYDVRPTDAADTAAITSSGVSALATHAGE